MDSDAQPATPDERIDATDPHPAHPVTNVVVHAGDAVVPDTTPTNAEFRLYDAGGRHYATLIARAISDGAYRVATVRYVGRKLLPLRPLDVSHILQPDTPPVSDETTTYTITVPVDPGRPDLYATAVVHAHLHWHPDFRPGDRGSARHSHPHPHSGTDVHRASLAGHDDDPHEHPHP